MTGMNSILDTTRNLVTPHPEKYKRRPNPPGYRKKNGEFQVLFNKQQIRIQKKSGLFPMGKTVPKVQTRIPKETILKQARILPQY